MDSSNQLTKFLKQCSLKITSSAASNSSASSSTDVSPPSSVSTSHGLLSMHSFDEASHLSAIPENPKFVTALYKYKTQDKNELSFRKGDKLVVLDDYAPGWWIARKLTTFGSAEKQGCIPMNYVSLNLEDKDWYFGNITRKQSERYLLEGDNPRGSYLIRKCDQEPDYYMLSLRDLTNQVKHYPILTKQNGDFYINSSDGSFPKLDDLIEHYSKIDSIDVNFQRLTQPCVGRPAEVIAESDLSDEIHEIKYKKLHFIRELVWLSNDCCKVWYGTFRKYKVKTPVAIKTLEPGSMSAAAFFHEARIMHKFRHESLHSLVGVCSIDKKPLIITEYMVKGDLLTYLRENVEVDSLNVKNLLGMASQILAGMAFLEEKKVVHRNLMARNCLVDFDGRVKVANFTQTRVMHGDFYITKEREGLFPAKWTAPEAINQGIFSTKSDIWSFGIVLFEIITKGGVPYLKEGIAHGDVLERVEHGHRMDKPELNCPEPVYQRMTECWDREPEKRPTFKYLHCYFDNFSASIEEEEQIENPYESIELYSTI